MMYPMKKIINHDEEIILPKCMYFVRNPVVFIEEENTDINISNQKQTSTMAHLEHRQDLLLKKLDILYERIKAISTRCDSSSQLDDITSGASLPEPEEVVLVLSPESLPWYLNIILKETSPAMNISWHIHSSVGNEKVQKITNYLNSLPNSTNSKVNFRLIFKNISTDAELKLSSLALPILGNVNILRYLSFVYPSVLPYDPTNHVVDNLLDICHVLERTPEKNKEALVNKLFSSYKDWLYGTQYTIVDVAAYNVIKQWKNTPKYVPKAWMDKFNKLCQ